MIITNISVGKFGNCQVNPPETVLIQWKLLFEKEMGGGGGGMF